MPVKIRPRSGEYYIIRRRIVRRGRFPVSFLSFPPCPSPRRSRSSTFGPCGCLHKMPRLFPGMQSSTGVASVLGRNISCYNTSGEGFRIGKVISRAYFSISGCVKFALAVRGEKFALLSNTVLSLPPLVNIQRQLRLRRVSDCRITPSSLSVASLSQRGFLSAALPSFRTEGVRNERA